MDFAPDPEQLKSLESLVETAGTLVKQLRDILGEIQRNPEAVSSPEASTSSTSTAPLDALALAHDSAALLKADVSKISLIIINSPFTPSAVISVLNRILAGSVPGLAASVQACDPNLYTVVFRRELAWRCHRTLSEFQTFLEKIPEDGKTLRKENEGFGPDGKGSIAVTGVLWSACDSVTSLAKGHVDGFFVQKMNEWKDTLVDTMEEMREWGDEEPNEEDEGDDDDETENHDAAGQPGTNHISAQSMLDDLMNSHRTIPLSDPDRIRPRLESSLRRLRLIILLYQAVTKRRMKKLPPLPLPNADNKVPQRLDEIAAVFQKLPQRFEDLAGAFYELRAGEIDEVMDQCFLDAFAASELLSKDWDDSRDEFTEWIEKFQVEIKKA